MRRAPRPAVEPYNLPVAPRGGFPLSIWAAAAPALIVTTPLIGLSLQGDERRKVYRAVHRYSGNPLGAARTALRDVDTYLDAGNFRPVGRFVQGFLHSLVFEASEFTGIAPHTTLGLIRVVMVLALVLVCTRMAAALARSAGVTRTTPVLALYPLALGATLVASGTEGALTQFSFTFIGAVVLIVATALATARDQDMDTRPLRWHEPIVMILLGAATATVYDLVYVAPALSLAYIAARAGASLTPFRHALRTAAVRRWAALSVGFLAVFVPVRIGIARRCGPGSCYDGSDLSLSADAVEVALFRSLGSTPPAGWSVNAFLARDSELDLGLLELLTTSLPVLVLFAFIALAVGVAAGICFSAADDADGNSPDDAAGSSQQALRRLAVVSGSFGAITVVLPALATSLSLWAQQTHQSFFPAWRDHGSVHALVEGIGHTYVPLVPAWRDTLMGQVGWSLVILALLAILLGTVRSSAGPKVACAVAAVLLGACVTLTLLANSRLALVDRHDPISSVTKQIGVAATSADATASGNASRCALIDRYTELAPTDAWYRGLRTDLDTLMADRYGWPFCDTAAVAEDDQ